MPCTGDPDMRFAARRACCRNPGRVTITEAGAHATFERLHLPDESVLADGDAEVDCMVMCARAIGSPVWEFATEPSTEQSKLVGCGGWLVVRIAAGCWPLAPIAWTCPNASGHAARM